MQDYSCQFICFFWIWKKWSQQTNSTAQLPFQQPTQWRWEEMFGESVSLLSHQQRWKPPAWWSDPDRVVHARSDRSVRRLSSEKGLCSDRWWKTNVCEALFQSMLWRYFLLSLCNCDQKQCIYLFSFVS